jgi:hypothetical protein
VCKTSLSSKAKFCPIWESHSEPGTKWILQSFWKQPDTKDKYSGAGTPGDGQGTVADNPQLAAAHQASKRAKKFLKATINEAKKQNPSQITSTGNNQLARLDTGAEEILLHYSTE